MVLLTLYFMTLYNGFIHTLLQDVLTLYSRFTQSLIQVYSQFTPCLLLLFPLFYSHRIPGVVSPCFMFYSHFTPELLTLCYRFTHTSMISHTFLCIFLTLFSGLLKLTLWVHSCITQAFFLAFSRYYTHSSTGVRTLCSRCTHNFFQVLLTLYSGFTHTLRLLYFDFSMGFTHKLHWL